MSIASDPTLIELQFFKDTGNAELAIRRVARELAEQAKKNPNFILTLVKQSGYPKWDKCVVRRRQQKVNIGARELGDLPPEEVVLVPMLDPNLKEVKNYLEAHLSMNVYIALVRSKSYLSFSFGDLKSNIFNAEKFAVEVMLLNKRVFNITKFKITDRDLFKFNFNVNGRQLEEDQFLVINLVQEDFGQYANQDAEDCYEIELWLNPDKRSV